MKANDQFLYHESGACFFSMTFQIHFFYELSYRIKQQAAARGICHCNINDESKTVEYRVDLKTDIIERPYSRGNELLFASEYPAIPAQRIEIRNHIIHKMPYKTPIAYDWRIFIEEGARNAMSIPVMQKLMRRQLIHDEFNRPIDVPIKVSGLLINWH